MDFLWFLIVGAIAGWLAGVIVKGRGFGLFGNIIVGILGAVIGGFVFRGLGLVAFGTIGAIIVALVGAIIFLFIVGLLRRNPL
jgi:uncharacterized membrane protein YeaQ/YmgE (transglycosylase-associated protein family)